MNAPVHSWNFKSISLCSYLTCTLSTYQSECCERWYRKPYYIKVDEIHCSPFPHQAGHLHVERCQVGQAWFTLNNSMLSTSKCFFIPNMFDKLVQKVLLHHLPCAEVRLTGLSVLPWMLLLAYHEARSDVCSLPNFRNLSQSPWPFKDSRKCPCNGIHQLP